MADETREIEYVFTSKDADLVSSLGRIDKGLKDTENQAKKTSKAIGKRGSGLGAGLEALNGLATEAGGVFADSAGFIEKFGIAAKTAAGGGIGAAVAVVGALVTATAGFAAGAVAAVRAAKGWRSELERFADVKDLGLIGPDGYRDISRANEALDQLAIVAKVIATQMAAEFAPAVMDGARAAIAAVTALRNMWSTLQQIGEVLSWLNPPLKLLNAGLAKLRGDAVEAVSSGDQLTEMLNEMAWAMQGEVGPSYDDFLDQLDKEAAGHTKAASKAKDHTEAILQVNEKLREMAATARSDTLTASQAINAEYDARIAKAADLAIAEENLAQVQETINALNARRERELTQLAIDEANARIDARGEEYAAWLESSQSTTDSIIADLDRLIEEYEAKADAIKETVMAIGTAALDTASVIANALTGIHQDQIDSILAGAQTMADGQKKLDAQQKAEVLKQFRRQQAAALAGALLNAASAAVAAVASPPGPPVSFAYLAPLAAQTGAQIDAIRKQEPPTLAHSGTGRVGDAPDERTMKLQVNEAVLNATARQQLGGTAGVNALNRGEGLNSGPRVIQYKYMHRILGEVFEDVYRGSESLRELLTTSSDGRSTATVTTSTDAL